MERIEPAEIVNAILAAPGWARVGITMPDARLRVEAAGELARTILSELRSESVDAGADQLTLSL